MIQGAVYDIPEDTPKLEPLLPALEQTQPDGTVCTFALDVPVRSWLQGIPGVTGRLEWFAIDYHADFWVEEPGRYSFSLDSDDGSLLFLDGLRIVNNDGVHEVGSADGHAELTKGMHHLRVPYYQGPRFGVALVLTVKPPNGKWKLFDVRDYRMPMQAASPTAMDDEQRPVLRRAAAAHDPLGARVYEQPAMAALLAAPPPHAFDFHLAILRFQPGVQSSQYAVAVEVPGAGIKIAQDINGTNRLHVVVLAQIRDEAGRVVERMSQDFSSAIPDGRLPAFRAGSIGYTHGVTLPPGRYTVEAAVADREANQASVQTVQFENPEFGGIALSDLMLVNKLEDVDGPPDQDDPLEHSGKRASPELGGVVSAASHPFIYFLVYPDPAAGGKPRMEVALSCAGRIVVRQTAELPAPDASGAIPMSIATLAAPGRYAIAIAIQQGSQRVERRLEYTLTGQ
ncbi:MAG: PA14 domain-containing protein [Bryobacteraceae bacterium]